MNAIGGSIARLLEIARNLRSMAEELHDVELKSRLVDEIAALLELRDSQPAGDTETIQLPQQPVPATHDPAAHTAERAHAHDGAHGRPTKLLGDTSIKVIEPTGDTETYSLSFGGEDSSEPAASGTAAKPGAASTASQKPIPPLTPEERSRQAEKRIAELEKHQHALVTQMNELLTPEQTKARTVATREGREAGKTGRELQQHIFDALKLRPDQKAQWAALRKSLQAVREEIATEIPHLLSDEQQQRLKG